MNLLVPIIFVLGMNANMVLLFRRKFGEVLPIALLLSALLVSVFGFCDFLKLGAMIVTGGGLVAYPMLVFLFVKKRDRFKGFVERYFSLGFVLFLVVYVFLFVSDYARKIQNWDEIVYWGLRVKEMMRIDKLYTSSESLMTFHQDYPPFIACFQYFWCQMSGGFRDSWLYLSTHLLELSLLIPCIEYFPKRKWKDNLVVVFITFMLILASGFFVDIENDAMMFKSIYIDAFMAILAAYGFFFVFMVKNIDSFYLTNVCLVASGLMLSKQSGLGFFIIMILIMIVNHCMLHWDACSKNLSEFVKRIAKKKVCFIALFTIVIPYVLYRIWEWYVVSLELTRQFDPENNRSVVSLLQILAGAGEAYQRTTIVNYLQGLLETTLVQRPVAMAYWQLILVTIVLFEVIAHLCKDQIPKKYIRMLNIVSTLGAIIYAAFMMMLYTFSCSEGEATSLASFRRYMNTYWMIIWIFAGLIIISVVAQRGKRLVELKILWIILAVLWIVLINPAEVRKLYPTTPSVSTGVLAEYVQDGESVYVLDVSENNTLYTRSFIKYKLWPVTVEGAIYMELQDKVTCDDFLKDLKDYDYLYVVKADEVFFEKYNMSDRGVELSQDKALYKIKENDATEMFKLLGKE